MTLTRFDVQQFSDYITMIVFPRWFHFLRVFSDRLNIPLLYIRK